jgi:hemolysin activation/secretion protein
MGVNVLDRHNATTMFDLPFSFTPGEPNGITKVSSRRFWQEFAMRSETQVLAFRSTFTWSRDNIEEIPGLPAGTVQPDQSYRLWLGQAQYARQVLDNGAQAIVRASLQQTSDNLTALDRMSVGGVNTVRGFRENQLVRDKGAVVNFEFDYPLVRGPGAGLNCSMIPFYDYGQGRNLHENASEISSWGLATRLRWKGVALDLALAHRLTHPSDVTTAGGTLQDNGIHVQLTYSLF